MITHDTEYNLLIDSIRDDATWKRLRPGLLDHRRIVGIDLHSYIMTECKHDQVKLTLNCLFPEVGFDSKQSEPFLVPHSYEIIVSYSPTWGLVYTQLSTSGKTYTADGLTQTNINLPEGQSISIENFVRRLDEEINKNYVSLSTEEKSVYLLAGGQVRAREIIKQVSELHQVFELILKRVWKRKRKIRWGQIAIGQWLCPIEYDRGKATLLTGLVINFLATQSLLQIYIHLIILCVYLS